MTDGNAHAVIDPPGDPDDGIVGTATGGANASAVVADPGAPVDGLAGTATGGATAAAVVGPPPDPVDGIVGTATGGTAGDGSALGDLLEADASLIGGVAAGGSALVVGGFVRTHRPRQDRRSVEAPGDVLVARSSVIAGVATGSGTARARGILSGQLRIARGALLVAAFSADFARASGAASARGRLLRAPPRFVRLSVASGGIARCRTEIVAGIASGTVVAAPPARAAAAKRKLDRAKIDADLLLIAA